MSAHAAAEGRETEFLDEELTPWQRVRRSLLGNRLAMAGGAVLVLFVLIAAVGWQGTSGDEPIFNPSTVRLPDKLKAPLSFPSRGIIPPETMPQLGIYLFGTDELGRDVFARMLQGAKVSMAVGVVSVGIAIFLGIMMGGVAGFYGDRQLGLATLLGALAGLGAAILLWHLLGALALGGATAGGLIGLGRAGRSAYGVSVAILLGALAGRILSPLGPDAASATSLWLGVFSVVLFSLLGGIICHLAEKSELLRPLRPLRLPRIDTIFIALVDVQLSFPTFFLILTVIALLPPSIWNIMVVIGVTGWVGPARFVRAEMLSLRERPFVEAAVAMGAGDVRLIFGHLVPNALAPVLVSATIGIASAILVEAGLSFLGFGVPPPDATWGNILSDGKKFLFDAPWLTLIPGISILLVVLAFNLFGEGLRDALNPRAKPE